MKNLLLLFALLFMLTAGKTSGQTYFTEDFETAFTGTPPAPPGWTQTMNRPVMTGDRNWVQNTWVAGAWSVASTGTNPVGAHSGTGVLWIDDANFGGTTTPVQSRRMESPVINLAGSTSPYVRFWYFNAEGTGVTLNVRVKVSGDGGATWHLLTPIVNGFTTSVWPWTWERISIAIPAPFRTAGFRFAFEITNRDGANNPFIDLVTVEEFTPTLIISSGIDFDWNSPFTWHGGVVPTADNNVLIGQFHTVKLPLTEGFIARTQNLLIKGTLEYHNNPNAVIHAYGNVEIRHPGILRAYFNNEGRIFYFGGTLFSINTHTGSVNFSVAPGLAQPPGSTTISPTASTLVFLGNQPAKLQNYGGLVGERINNVLHMNPGGVTYTGRMLTIPRTVGLYLGAVNPNGLLTLGNHPVTPAVEQTVEVANGLFTSNPIWNNVNISTRSNVYFSPNWVPLTQTAIIPGNEIELEGGVRTVTGTLTMNTHNNLQLGYLLRVGTATTGGMALDRGIIVTSDANLLQFSNPTGTIPGGTTPSTDIPTTTHGSYIAGPFKVTFPPGSATRNFPLGLGTGFNGATPNANTIRPVNISTGLDQSPGLAPIVSIVGAPNGTATSPLTTVMGARAFRINRDAGADLTASATITISGNNYTHGGGLNNDQLLGLQEELRVAQSTALTGPWTERSTSTGTGAIANNTLYSRTTATAAPGPIAPLATQGEFFAFATTAPGLSNMAYTSGTTVQNTDNLLNGTANAHVIGIQVVTSGVANPLVATRFTVNANGTTSIADIENARLFYTGTSPIFATTTQFGTTVASPAAANFDITGSQVLPEGTNHFWLTFDVKPGATPLNLVDAECVLVTVGGVDYIPTVTAPAGARTIRGPLAGTLTVGAGGNFTSFTNADGLFNDINTYGLSGNVTINVISDITTETGAVALNQWTEIGVGNYTLTIQPGAAAMRNISGTFAGGLIRLNGADRVTIDGSFGGNGRFLTIQNLSTAANTAAIQIISLGALAGATHNSIINSHIAAGSSTVSSTFGIFAGGAPLDAFWGYGANNNNLTISNNIITRAHYGVFARGATGAGANTGLIISNNIIGSDLAANYIGRFGLDITHATGASISGNEIYNIISSTEPNGMFLNTGFVNSVVSANKIHSIIFTGTSEGGGKGIYINTGVAASNVTITNNVISNLGGVGDQVFRDGVVGIGVWDATGGLHIYNNSINLYGTWNNAAVATRSAAVYLGPHVTGVDMRNNTFANSIVNGLHAGSRAYAVFNDGASTVFTTINFNNYFAAGTQGVLGFLGSDRTTLAHWRTATGQDAGSIAVNPLYTSNVNLIPQPGSPLLFAGTHIAAVTTDINGLARNHTPTIGAFEYEAGSTGPVVLYGAQDEGAYYHIWLNNSNAGIGFMPWELGTFFSFPDFALFSIDNPAHQGITGMDTLSFRIEAGSNGGQALATATRPFSLPLPVGTTFSFDWWVRLQHVSTGFARFDLLGVPTYNPTEILVIRKDYTGIVRIQGDTMFTQPGFHPMRLKFTRVPGGLIRVRGTGMNGTESFDRTFPIALAPSHFTFRVFATPPFETIDVFFSDLKISTGTAGVLPTSTTLIRGRVLLDDNITTGNLLIDPGHFLHVNPLRQITVAGQLRNSYDPGALFLRSNAAGAGATLLHNTEGVFAAMERVFPGARQWRLLSSAVANQAITGPWTPAAPNHGYDFYAWDEPAATWRNQKVAANNITHFVPGRGYLVSFEAADLIQHFTGPLNNGNITVPVVRQNTGPFAGANLLGNPYPSAIDWHLADRTLFTDHFAYVYERVTTGHGTTEGFFPVNGAVPGALIAPNQGFFVLKRNPGTANFIFTNAMRTHGGVFKTAPAHERIILTLSHSGWFDQTEINNQPGSTPVREANDALKFFSYNNLMPQIYSLSSDGIRLAINSAGEINQESEFRIGIKAPVAGQYTLQVEGIANAFAGLPVFLRDLVTGAVHNLRENPRISFQSPKTEPTDRFVLSFVQPTHVGDLTADATRIFYTNGRLHLQFAREDNNRQLQVIDLTGRVVLSKSLHGMGASITVPLQAEPGAYIVRITGDGTAVSQRILVR